MTLKNIWTACALLLCITASPLSAYYYDIQARVGAYYYTSHQAREAFQRATPVYEIETSMFFDDPWMWIPWKAWVNGSFMAGSGDNERLGRTHSNLTSLSLGLKHSWRLDCYGGTFYLGGGPSLSWLRMKTHAVLPEGFIDGAFIGHRKISKKNFGFVLKAGYQMKLWGWLLADVFGDYQLLTFHYRNFARMDLFVPGSHHRRDGHHRLDLNGFKVGGALGFAF
jgi:hypothetical protein